MNPTPRFGRACLPLWAALFLSFTLSVFAADAVKKFDVPAGEAAVTLKQAAQQGGVEIAFPATTVRGVQTAAVKGTFTAREALNRMLAGTDLMLVQDSPSGALTVNRIAADAKNAASRPADAAAANAAAGTTMFAREAVQLDEFTVTGTRLRGLLDGATAQPVLALDAAQIERTGAQSIGDVLRYIPQVSAFTTGQGNTQSTVTTLINTQTGATSISAAAGALDATAGRVTATIRGAPAGATLLLIDGKRVPKNNQSRSGDGYDLNGIPLAAVERIEVLLDGASSIYGADAMGGVINVILKKNYRGTEVRAGYENAFDTDAAIKTASLSHGFAAGKLRGLITLSYEEANSLALRDRALTASYDRRPFGGGDYRNATQVSGAGRVSRTGTVPLPGLTTTISAIPSGTTGTNLTVADYLNAGAVPDPFDLGQYMDFAPSYERTAALAKLDYAFRDWLELYAEVRVARNRNTSDAAPIMAQNLSIPAGYPGNPFGIPVTLNKWFLDLRPQRIATNDTETFTVGANGRLPKGWRYDASLSRASSHLTLDGDAGATISAALFTSAVAAGQTPNLFYDSSRVRNPNAAGVIEALTATTRDEEQSETWTYSLMFDGPVYELPGGSIAAALGAERREEYVDFPLRSATDTIGALPGSDQVNAYFAELNVPIFGGEARLPLVRQLNFSAAYRFEDYGRGDVSKNPRAGVAWRPATWLLVRGSYGEGFKVPTLQQRNAPITVANSNTAATAANLDPLRGNTVNAIYPATRGGKADLLPERSENTTAGLVLEVPPVKGLSLSFDWFDNIYRDRVGTLLFNQMALLYPQRITRGAALPTDQPGWAGPVTAADLRPINVAYSQTVGYDVGVKLDRRTPWGDALVSLSGTKYTKNVLIPSADGIQSPTVNTDSLPVQVNGNAFFSRDAWGAGVLATYRAANRSTTTRTATPSAIRWDVQFNYDFAKAAWVRERGGWTSKLLADTKLSVTIYNVLDREPPLDYSFFTDNTVLDPRLRRFALSLRRTF
jgi:outer membrane receptor protein involved in Fe transport